MKKPRRNDATFCRLKNWCVGDILTIEREMIYAAVPAGYDFSTRIRITAIGEEAILIRRVYSVQAKRLEGSEQRWVRTLINCLVTKAEKTHV